MSDTPLDTELTQKSSTRKPEYMAERITEFREEYNERINSLPIDDEHKATFILDSDSEARRRLIDMGMAYHVQYGSPFGFSFDPEKMPYNLDQCPQCGERDDWLFRMGADLITDDDTETMAFVKLRCLSCGSTHNLRDRYPTYEGATESK